MHTLTLRVDSITKILLPMLRSPGWTDDIGLVYATGTLLALPELTADFTNTADEHAVTLVVSETQREAIKAALREAAKKKLLPAGPHTNTLLVAVGLIDPAKA